MKFLRVLLPICLLAGGAVADEPWKVKDFRNWTQEDAMRILRDSPWSKRVATKIEFVRESSENKSTGGKNISSETDRGDMRPTEFATVVWWSARTPRLAYLRVFELSGNKPSEEQVKEHSELNKENWEVVLWASDETLKLSAALTPEELKKAAWLESARVKARIEPGEVVILKTPQGKPDRIIFRFPRDWEGQPIVTEQDKKVSFKWKLPQKKDETVAKAKQFEAQFDPRKMLVKNEPDI